jgi:hypothetical protein
VPIVVSGRQRWGPPLGGSAKLCSRIVLHHGVKGETARKSSDIGVGTIMSVSEIPHTPERERPKAACKGLGSALDASCGGLQRFDILGYCLLER